MNEIKISDAAKKLAEENQIDITTLTGTGNGGSITVNDVKAAIQPGKNEEDEAPETDDITVADPEILRPKELPLVVTPGSKGWANEAQATYAALLNGYAYKNPTKFKAKKAILIAQLKALAENPGLLAVYQGGGEGDGKLAFKNHITQGNS
jgi:pyruvate/2-oxoglutarate dehydrogenase complex dihydrolipoamide acyltransferase (E2) component